MQQRDTLVEVRSFDHVPESERHGTVRSQVQFWFMVNATLITLFTGAVGPLFGLGLSWTLLAIVIGSIAGTMFQAFHGAQGPHMGLPQMIQSRVQFGSRGAILPLAAVTIVQFGFAIFYIQTGASSLADVTVDQPVLFPMLVGVAAVVLAIVGYRLLLRVEKIASYIMLVNLLLLTVAAAAVLPIGAMLSDSMFAPVAFLAQAGAAATYQLAIARSSPTTPATCRRRRAAGPFPRRFSAAHSSPLCGWSPSGLHWLSPSRERTSLPPSGIWAIHSASGSVPPRWWSASFPA
jgi:NCS1 family nucleobase:cation symporter-1